MDDATSRFELVVELPNRGIEQRTSRLIGFEPRFHRIRADLEMLLAPERVREWSKRLHGTILPVCAVLEDRCPLVVFHGDVGTGKTATAEGVADRLSRVHDAEATLLKLSTRVRGKGLHGEMSKLLGEAFDEVVARAGKGRMAFLIIDEADALASTRESAQLHQEEKAGTNTLIQKIDGVRQQHGRILVFLCTNRLHALNPAIVRRARLERFDRPDEEQRRQLLAQDLDGIRLTGRELDELVQLTGPDPQHHRLGMTFSDLRTRLLPAAVAQVFPDRKLTFAILREAAQSTLPSPVLEERRD